VSKVFCGGSRSLGRLDSVVRARLRNLITHGHTVLVGDASGIDKAVQAFFAAEDYRDVVVYCMEAQCRHNVGNWPIESVSSGGKAKDFAYFAVKDARMGVQADYGFMIWDGASKGTLNNVLSLLEQGKPVLLYRSTTREFLQIQSVQQLEPLLDACPADVVAYLNKKINLEERVRTAAQSSLGF
jgi:hypothetical protein